MAVPETVDLTQLNPEEEVQRRLAASVPPNPKNEAERGQSKGYQWRAR